MRTCLLQGLDDFLHVGQLTGVRLKGKFHHHITNVTYCVLSILHSRIKRTPRVMILLLVYRRRIDITLKDTHIPALTSVHLQNDYYKSG